MKMRPTLVANLFLLAALVVPSASAEAQFTAGTTPCENGSALTAFNPDAIACSGSWIGNNAAGPSIPGVLSIITADFLSYVGAGSWSYLGTTNTGQTSGPFSYVPSSFTGLLTFDSQMQGLFAIALKSSTHFSIYLFDAGPGLSSVDFTTIGTSLNKRGIAQDLSHASLYEFDPAAPPPPVTATPEPGTLVLTLSGLASMGGYIRRRRRGVIA